MGKLCRTMDITKPNLYRKLLDVILFKRHFSVVAVVLRKITETGLISVANPYLSLITITKKKSMPLTPI